MVNDRPCVHLFAPCPDECQSYLYRATEITERARRELRRDRNTNFAVMFFFALALEAGLLIGGVSIWQAGAENWSSTIIANSEN
jgi:hypothetical protein